MKDDALKQTIDAVVKANEGKVLRVTRGVAQPTSPPTKAGCSCPGSCFCVTQNGACHCEAYYCENGVCIIVNCPGSC